MSIRLQVQWPNATHPLLANPQVTVLVDGTETPPISAQVGRWRYDIAPGATHVLVQVTFTPTLPIHVGGGPDVTDTAVDVLHADQAYLVDGTSLRPDPTPFHLVNGEVIAQNVHPLIDTVSAGNAAAGLTIAEVRTEYVDLTRVWRKVALASSIAIYDSETEPEITLAAVGATQGGPPLWFANFPVGLEPPSPEVSTLVFLRPALQYGYTVAWEKAHAGRFGQANLNRYLLAPKDPEQPFLVNGRLHKRPADTFWFMDPFFALRASFQKALRNGGKPMVVLHPWPTDGLNFGDAVTSRLPVALQGILRLLRGMGHLGMNHPGVALGRLGMAFFSRSGLKMKDALFANRHLLRELYLFDPLALAEIAPFVIQWASHTPDFRLRMVASDGWATMMGIFRAVRDNVSGEAGDLFLSALPESPVFWEGPDKGGNPYWNFVMQKFPQFRDDRAVRHQFVIFGGRTITVDDQNRMTANVTWLEEFLKGSGF